MVSPALAVVPAAGVCAAILPTSTSSELMESPAWLLRPSCDKIASASEGDFPLRSGTVTSAAGSAPFETTILICVPLATLCPASGSWSITFPFSTVDENSSFTVPRWKKLELSIFIKASCCVRLRRFGTSCVAP